jgi:hypothetical protein
MCSGHDRAIYMYAETKELLFLEEEQEKRQEKEYEKELLNSQQFNNDNEYEATHTTKRTIDSLSAAERLAESIDLSMEEDLKPNDEKGSNPLMLKMNSTDYLWNSIKKGIFNIKKS